MAVKAKAEITLATIRDVQSVTRYYLLQSSTSSMPAKPTANPPGGSWVKTEPSYTSGSTNSLYFTDLTVFTDASFSYSDVSLSSSYEAAMAAYNKAVAAEGTASTALAQSVEYIVGTQTAATGTWTGVSADGALYAGKSIAELGWGRKYSVYVVKLRRGERIIPMPSARMVLHSGDKIHVIGERHSLDAFKMTAEIEGEPRIRTLRTFFEEPYDDREHALACTAIKVRGTESYVGKPIRKSGINSRSRCMILGLEREGYAQTMPDANMLIAAGDILWIIGTESSLNVIASKSVGRAGKHADDDQELKAQRA